MNLTTTQGNCGGKFIQENKFKKRHIFERFSFGALRCWLRVALIDNKLVFLQ